MTFFEASELNQSFRTLMNEYDGFIRQKIGPDYPYPLRMRDWELYQVLTRLPKQPGAYDILDTGSFNTYMGLWLARLARKVVVSDIYGARRCKELLRKVGILPRKNTEAPFFAWRSAIKKAATNIDIRTVDLTQMPYPNDTFDFITSISVVEHIPAIEQALTEMYRCLKPGGKLLITTDVIGGGKPYADGVRYFTPVEVEKLFALYPVTSPSRAPDFRRKNWCYYGRNKPILTAFIEVTKPLK